MVSICPDPDPWSKHSKGQWGRDCVILCGPWRVTGKARVEAKLLTQLHHLSHEHDLPLLRDWGVGKRCFLMICEPEGPNPKSYPASAGVCDPRPRSVVVLDAIEQGQPLGSATIQEQSWTSWGLSAARWGWKNIRVILLCQQHWKTMWFMVNPTGSSNRGQTTSSVPSRHHTESRERLGELLNEWPGLHGQVSVPKSMLQRKLTSPPSQPGMGRTLGKHSPMVMNPKLRGSVRCIVR